MNDDFFRNGNPVPPEEPEEEKNPEEPENTEESPDFPSQNDAAKEEGSNPFPGTPADSSSLNTDSSGFGYRSPAGQNSGYNSPFYQNSSYNGQPFGSSPPSQPPYSPNNSGGQYGYSPVNGGGMPPKKNNSGMRVFIVLIVAIIALAAVLIVSIFMRQSTGNPVEMEKTSANLASDTDTDNVGSLSASESSLNAGEAAEVAVIAKKFNVGILIYKNDSLYTEGSGVVLQEDDDHQYTYIVTCAHVVNYSGVAVSVLMEDGTEYPAEVIGLDTRTDLAVVRIEVSGLDKAEIADSKDLIVGQTVYAVGNPGGSEFFGSVTNGIISAIDRPISSSTGYEMVCIQHTAAINPGNSGGALVNGEGKLIGINSMKIASTEYEGMGFAVPSSVVIEVFNSIIENGYVAGRAKLGITYATPSNYSQTYAMYVQMKGLPSGTIVIVDVSEDSDLAAQGVKKGDMITKVNGKAMTDSGMLSAMIEDMSVGDTLTLTIVRVNTDNWSQTEMEVTVSLVEDKGTSATQSTEDNNDSSSGSNGYQDWYDYFKQYYGY